MKPRGIGILWRVLIVILAADAAGIAIGAIRVHLMLKSQREGVPDSTGIAQALVSVVIGVVAVHLLIGLGAIFVWRRGAAQLGSDLEQIASGQERQQVRRAGVPELDSVIVQMNRALRSLRREIEHHRSKYRKARAIVRSMPGAVLALDREQRILDVNRVGERLLGIREEEAQGRLLQETLRSEALNTFVQEAFATQSPVVGEFLLDAGERGPRTVQVNSRSLRDATGELTGRVIVMQDVTRLRRLERVRRDFAANVSHELRTPVTNIKGYVETLLALGPDEQAESERFLQIIARNADRLTQIVEGMLELARLDDPSAHETLAVSMAPLKTIVDLVMGQLHDAMAHRSMRPEVSIPDELQACVNARLIEQAIHNLVTNAIKYGNEGTAIEITGRQLETNADTERDDPGEGAFVELSVFSQGQGIEKKHLPRIFERFYRVDPARTSDSGGVGLGLAIVKHITRLHGGREGVESIPGQGVRFWLRLPVQNQDSDEAEIT
jgi:two-component system, OmpR family, phosphate regulon sensor histidine kinase PhoR